ncbi:MAG TPA: MEDS domain-containing protein [Chthoniobacterales bacterium]|nr:MEDS domain-containing protein [Chthoniobacterales bacterium]
MTSSTQLLASLEQLGPHDHFCSIYESPEEHYAVAIPFMQMGLERGEKCIYIAGDGTTDHVRQRMESEGIDVERATESNALVVAGKEQAYLKHGSFDPDWMFNFWKEATDSAMSEGFSALRVTGETEWVVRGGQGLERWMEYESKLTHALLENNCSALCQYNRRHFPPDVILDVIRTHPVVVYRGTVCRNFFYVPADEFLGTNETEREVERLLTSIREREEVEHALREQLIERERAEEALRRSRDELEMKVKERTTELRNTNDDLQSVNRELEAFAYSVSHDLRAPLRHIAGFTELLQKHSDSVLDDKGRGHIGMIRTAANRMDNLVDDLLGFSRIGRAETQTTTIDLAQLVNEVVSEIAPDTKDRNLVWRIGSLPIGSGDRSMLRLVFVNLISNAVKFTRTRDQAEIEIGSLDHGPDKLVVFVKDNGVGFNMKYQEKLFGVFQRLHSQEAFEGTGIGLATVQRIIHRHGGRVWAEGSINGGATFYVALPKSGKTKT